MVKRPTDEALTACPERRGFLRRVGWAALGMAPARAALANTDAPRVLSFAHTHTGETLTATYYDSGGYRAEVLDQINMLLRDFRNGAVYPIDPKLLDRLYALQTVAGGHEAFQIISGYRSPATNAALRAQSSGVAEHSLHMEGRAIDVRLPGLATNQLALLAQNQMSGGVGYYRSADFVHLDTGRVRNWGDALDH